MSFEALKRELAASDSAKDEQLVAFLLAIEEGKIAATQKRQSKKSVGVDLPHLAAMKDRQPCLPKAASLTA